MRVQACVAGEKQLFTVKSKSCEVVEWKEFSMRQSKKPLFTVFTPTYERAASIHRVYDSLKVQTMRDFEWIVVDDGSTDGTDALIKGWAAQADFPVTYLRQKHAGKHMAWNNALNHAKGQFFVIADSDDAFRPDSLERFWTMWRSIPVDHRGRYRGVACRCVDEYGNFVGDSAIPDPWLDASELDAKYKYHLQYEMWGMTRIDVLREYPNPDIKGLRFYPECIIWDEIGKKYLTRYFNEPLRVLYHDQANATTIKYVNNRFRENYYLWRHVLNDLNAYADRDPKLFLKSLVGIMRDGILSGRSYGTIITDIRPAIWKCLAVFLSPAGLLLAKKNRENNNVRCFLCFWLKRD